MIDEGFTELHVERYLTEMGRNLGSTLKISDTEVTINHVL